MLHTIVEFLRSFSLRCPHCHQGKVMRHWFAVNAECSHCRYVFQAEQGDFWGGMIFAYTYGGVLAFGFAGLLIKFDLLSIEMRVYATALLIAVLIVALTPFTRSNWVTVMYLTRGRDQEYLPQGKPKA